MADLFFLEVPCSCRLFQLVKTSVKFSCIKSCNAYNLNSVPCIALAYVS